LQPVRLVLLLLAGSRAGDNDFVDFASVEEAVAYGAEIVGDRRIQVDGIEDAAGRSLVSYDDLQERCRAWRNGSYALPRRSSAA
jgi:hypothetical protein